MFRIHFNLPTHRPSTAPTMTGSLNAHDTDPNNLPRVDDEVHGHDDFPTLEELMKELGTEDPDFDEEDEEEQLSDDDESWDEDIRPEDEDWEVAEKGKPQPWIHSDRSHTDLCTRFHQAV